MNQTKVQGNFLIGITNAFYNLEAITSSEFDDYLSDIEPEGWYPIEIILTIFDNLNLLGHYPLLFYKAGAMFIQSWYDNGGKRLAHGSLGQFKLQDNSQGIKLVFKDYDPETLYSKVIELNEEEGFSIIEVCDLLPKEFTYGVFDHGLTMWHDLVWIDAHHQVIEEKDGYTKSLLTYHFRIQDSVYDNEYIDNFIDELTLNKDVVVNNALAVEIAWKLKGMKNELNTEKMIHDRTKEVLNKVLQKQVCMIDDLEAANEKIKQQTFTDFLTGIFNKRYFDLEYGRLWNRSLRRHETITVLMLDIDYFKLYNDEYGHLVGDKALKLVAQTIYSAVQRSDDIVARFGGEEFIVASANLSIDQVNQLVRHIMADLKAAKILHKRSPISSFLTISIGSAIADPNSNITPAELISRADTALYEAKNRGRNCHINKKTSV